ncbi:hypothetical protein ACSCB1_39270 [Streptomyces europaeiscabiei]|uniref:hypothetical protein n=1 Tax=Streptomyces europaeiscabiei TaxID=146819 RepID=UPI00131BA51F|nr:hypothetical protein [Streptomyces europaeiscabiei]
MGSRAIMVAAGESSPAWAVALIAALGALFGVIITVAGTVYAANKKVKELELTYQQKLQEAYLQNARSYLDSVYLPLHVAVSKLAVSYEAFRAFVDFNAQTVESTRSDVFRAAVHDYNGTLDSLFDRGAGAFLTVDLESRLEAFNGFVRRSLDSTEVRRKLLVSSSSMGVGQKTELETRRRIRSLSLHVAGMSFSLDSRVISAPTHTREFEEKFIADIAILRTLIKEVTLGAHSRA